MSEDLADRIEALDAKATAGEWLAPRRTSVIGSGIIAAPVGRMVGDIFEHDNAALIVALRNAVPEILAALRLAETSSTHGQYDPNDPANERALADRVETSAAEDVAGLVELLEAAEAVLMEHHGGLKAADPRTPAIFPVWQIIRKALAVLHGGAS